MLFDGFCVKKIVFQVKKKFHAWNLFSVDNEAFTTTVLPEIDNLRLIEEKNY